jgi:hypothetical protein
VKWLIIGKFTEMNEEEKLQPWNRFRYWLMAKLLPGGGLGGVAKLVGTHYEIISIIYRLLGAKVIINLLFLSPAYSPSFLCSFFCLFSLHLFHRLERISIGQEVA